MSYTARVFTQILNKTMEKILTINEFYEKCRGSLEFDPNGEGHPPNPKQVAVAFAKLHVTEALKQAGKVLDTNADADFLKYPTVEGIIDSYPLENIK